MTSKGQLRRGWGNSKPKENEMLFREGLGCWFHDNCFTCPLQNADQCKWNCDHAYSRHRIVDIETHRKLVFGQPEPQKEIENER